MSDSEKLEVSNKQMFARMFLEIIVGAFAQETTELQIDLSVEKYGKKYDFSVYMDIISFKIDGKEAIKLSEE